MSAEQQRTLLAMLNQISSATVVRKDPKARQNPKPPGTIQQGSATEAVLAVMKENPSAMFTESQFRWKTGFSHSAVSWALLRLKRNGRIDVFGNGSTNPRFCRYRLKPEAANV